MAAGLLVLFFGGSYPEHILVKTPKKVFCQGKEKKHLN